ncbi:hypothetical protein [Pelobacter seleniigenes]|uniref:hypothetical protein n=1 Tax=Pelobacter seleniigenes TaxID=407188 RepID=UPI0004A6B3DA|nr:hypothetical protein [Pelobacter seleniigenes]
MNSKEAYLNKLEGQLNEWNAQINLLLSRARETGASDSEAITYLQQKKTLAQTKLEKLKNAGEQDWQSLQEEIDDAWSNLGVAIKTALAKL